MSKLFDLSGKVALVTGASSGLGAHFAKCLGEAGASVVLAARRADRLQSLQAELAAKNIKATTVDLDVQSAESVGAALEKAGPLDIVINNAGISIVKPALEMPEKDWDAVVDTNLRGAWLVAQGAAKRWVADKRPGSIVNIASILGLRTIGQVAPYNASKAGLIHLTQALAMEWARYRIRVNAICPGYIETEMNSPFWKTPAGQKLIERIPQRRIGQPEHLDGALLLLASDAGTFMTGSVLTVDGGHMVSSLQSRVRLGRTNKKGCPKSQASHYRGKITAKETVWQHPPDPIDEIPFASEGDRDDRLRIGFRDVELGDRRRARQDGRAGAHRSGQLADAERGVL
jgi:NAD(P)-dependent dehydrogenase (short-subunit alcohol dehydrogenase family)